MRLIIHAPNCLLRPTTPFICPLPHSSSDTLRRSLSLSLFYVHLLWQSSRMSYSGWTWWGAHLNQASVGEDATYAHTHTLTNFCNKNAQVQTVRFYACSVKLIITIFIIAHTSSPEHLNTSTPTHTHTHMVGWSGTSFLALSPYLSPRTNFTIRWPQLQQIQSSLLPTMARPRFTDLFPFVALIKPQFAHTRTKMFTFSLRKGPIRKRRTRGEWNSISQHYLPTKWPTNDHSFPFYFLFHRQLKPNRL